MFWNKSKNTENISGVLISPEMLGFLRFTVNYSYFYRVMPFNWPTTSQFILFHRPPTWNLLNRHSIVYIFGIYYIILLWRLGVAIINPEMILMDFRVFTMELIFLGMLSLMTGIQFSLFQRGRLFVRVINRFLLYYTKIQEWHKSKTITVPEFHAELRLASLIFLQAAFVSPILIVIIYFRRPDEPYFFTSVIFTNVGSDPLWIQILVGLPTFWVLSANWACILNYTTMGVFPIYSSIFLLTQLKPGRSSQYTSDTLRHPINFISTYRSLQLLLRGYNGVTRDYLLLIVSNSCTGFSVWCNYLIIKFHHQLTIETLGMTLITSIIATGVLLTIYIKFGEINEISKRVLHLWKISPPHGNWIDWEPKDTLLFKKYVKSCRALRIDTGNFGFYNRPTSIRVVGKLVVYTVKFLIIMNKIMANYI